MVLTVDDLPSGWSAKAKWEWLTGVIAPREPWAARARAAGSRTLVVGFRFDRNVWTRVFSEAVPLVSSEDAKAAFPSVADRMVRNPSRKVSISGREIVTLEATVGDEQTCYLLRTQNSRRPGIKGENYQLFWRTGSAIALLNVSGEEGTWQLNDLAALAAKQDARIRTTLANFRPESAID